MNSVFAVLTVIFVIAKLAGLVSWSWLVVFSPLILAVVLGTVFVGFLLAAAVIASKV